MKYLVIGSAPYIKDWYTENGHKYLDAGYKLVAINNAWILDPDNLHFWYHSTDFYKVAQVIPTREEKNSLDKVERMTDVMGVNMYSYEVKQHGTMILNVLVTLLNRAVIKQDNLEVCVAGADCVYNPEQTHFYGQSTQDPLRMGVEYLIEQLNKIQGFYEKERFKIFNVGGQEETLLPFDRKTL